MRYITRIHLSDCGWREAYYSGTTIDLTDPRTGKPTHTVFNMENTGGKTSFLSLVLSCFDTNERRFLKTLIRQNQKFGDYFWSAPAFILVEWDLSSDQASLLEMPRLVTGQVVVPCGEGQQRELERHFFTFRSTPDLAFEDIPAPGLRGFARGRLNGRKDVQRWLYEMRSSHPGNFQAFDNQTNWKRKLAEEKIDTALLAAQVEFNRCEGGIEDFLNFRDESQFVRKFLRMTLPDSEADEVRRVLADHVDKLSDRPKLIRRRDAMRQLEERFAPFVEIADKVLSTRSDVERQVAYAASLKAALGKRGVQAAEQAEKLAKVASDHEAAAKDAAAKGREAQVLYASAVVEMARRKAESADALAKECEQKLAEARLRRRLLSAAVLFREIQDDRARSEGLLQDIDSQNAGLEPRREQIRAIGADLKVTLEQRAADARERQRALSDEAAKRTAEAEATEKTRIIADERARTAAQDVSRIERSIQHVDEQRTVLERKEVLQAGESAIAAADRHTRAAQAAADHALELSDRVNAMEIAAKEEADRRSGLKAERAHLEGEIKPMLAVAKGGDAKRRELAFHQTILKLTGENEVDPDTDTVVRALTDARRKTANALRDAERRQEVLQADRESLEAVGLASIDKDALGVAERLRESGIRDAQPYAAWLSSIVDSPTEIRRFAEMDPARFVGVAVPDQNSLARARDALRSGAPLNRPVVVAVASDAPGENPDDRFVVTVDRAAAYDRVAARALRRQIEKALDELADSIRKDQERIEHLDATSRDLDAWREQFGHGRLAALWRDIERKQERIADIDRESATLSGRIAASERDILSLRQEARDFEAQAYAASEFARRAHDFDETWESRLVAWRAELSEHEHVAKDAENRAKGEERRRDALQREIQELYGKVKGAVESAAALEREAAEIAYAASGGRLAPDVDVLRRDYQQRLRVLQSLESNRVDHLRGRKEEIDEALTHKQSRFEKDFGALDRSEVKEVAARDGLEETTQAAEAGLDKAQIAVSDSRSEAISAEREYQSEKDRRAKEVRSTSLIGLSDLAAEELADAMQRGQRTIEEQQNHKAQEDEAARRTRDEAARCHHIAKDCEQQVATIDGVLDETTPPPGRIVLPSEEEIAAFVTRTVSELSRARREFEHLRGDVYQRYDEIRKFTNSDAFKQLEGEREVAAHLAANEPLAAAASARKTAGLIDDRLKTIDHDLSRLDDDLQTCVAELNRLLSTAVHILRRMTRDGRIPEHVPRFGGQPVFRMSADLSRVTQAQRKEMLVNYVTDLADVDRIPESGHDIAAELIGRMTSALGRKTLGIQLLKPKGEGDTEHMPIDQVTVSGGELLTAAMMIYLVLARLRAESMHGRTAEGGILIMDNPFGKANKALLLKTQIGLADAMGIQLFYTTGVQDTSALAEFENIVRLRRNKQSSTTRRIHVEAMRVLIDKQTGTERTVLATTEEAAE